MVEIGSGIVALGAALAIGAGAIGTAMAQSNIGAAGMGLMAEKDGKEGQVLLFLAIPETMVILGFVVAYLIISTLGA
ncbi:ATP synthase subunit C [Candidatus Norongarragalina meridionalis]|nr:ATP synthase subunit C [Candidatus Norongarragalina meridionalis]